MDKVKYKHDKWSNGTFDLVVHSLEAWFSLGKQYFQIFQLFEI